MTDRALDRIIATEFCGWRLIERGGDIYYSKPGQVGYWPLPPFSSDPGALMQALLEIAMQGGSFALTPHQVWVLLPDTGQSITSPILSSDPRHVAWTGASTIVLAIKTRKALHAAAPQPVAV